MCSAAPFEGLVEFSVRSDGAGNQGTISAAKFQEDWVRFARRWGGNPTVIGFDIRNEPCAHTKTPALWGGKGSTDIHAMYEAVGNAILAVNPDALIICEAVIMVGLGLPAGAKPERLRWGGRPGTPRTGTLYQPDALPPCIMRATL